MSHSDTGDSSKGNYSIHELNAVEILELLERADMVEVSERPPSRYALSIRTRLMQVEWDLDKRLRVQHSPHLLRQHQHQHHQHQQQQIHRHSHPVGTTAGKQQLSTTNSLPSTTPSPKPTTLSRIQSSSTSTTSSTPHIISRSSSSMSSYSPITSNLPTLPDDSGEMWHQILKKVRDANSKLLGMDRTLPFTVSKHYTPAGGTQQSGPPELEDSDIKYNPKTDYIGEGSYGVVYKGTCRGKKVAIKVPKRKLGPRQIEQFKAEIAIMSKIYHPNIVLFMGACIKPTIKIVTELCSTDLETLLQVQSGRLSLFDRMKMASGAALGMNWLHGICNIIHRDLKTANLLVTEDGTVKVADFGFGHFFGVNVHSPDSRCGTPLWMAPEVIAGKETNEMLDVYSFGIILWQLLSLKKPFYHLTINSWDDFKNYVCVEDQRPVMPPNTIPILSYLINKCWHTDPKERPTFSEIVFRLQEVLVDCVIRHEGGRMFWREHFLLNHDALVETVELPTFCSILLSHLNLTAIIQNSPQVGPRTSLGTTSLSGGLETRGSTPRRKGPEDDRAMLVLRHFLVDTDISLMSSRGPCVSMKSFDRTVFFFGDYTSKDYGASILETIMIWVSLPYFHGDISKEEVSTLLQRYEVGTYLVRLSCTTLGKPLTLSVLTSTTHIDHRRISVYNPGRPDKQYTTTIENQTYTGSTLQDLIVACGPVLKLTSPCPKKLEWTSDYLS